MLVTQRNLEFQQILGFMRFSVELALEACLWLPADIKPLQPEKDQRRLTTFTISAWDVTPFVAKTYRLKALIE